MRIGIAGPMSLELLDLSGRPSLPRSYSFPMISGLVNGLLREGHSVVAFTTSIDLRQPLVHRDGNLTVCIAPREPHSARDLFRSERKSLLQLMQQYEVDLIHAHWTYEFAWAALDTGRPVLVTVHDHAPTIFRYQPDPYRLSKLLMNLFVLRKAKHLSVVSPYLAKQLHRSVQTRAKIIPNFFDAELTMRHAPSNRTRFILSVSNGFGKLKNVRTALAAFALVRKMYPDLEYHLIGDAMALGGLAHAYALTHGIADGVGFCGVLPHGAVIEKLRDASIFLHPSREESFGMSVLEAMVIGTPVVAGRRSGNIPFLLDNGKAGELCRVDRAESIAGAVIHLLSDLESAIRLSGYARSFAQNHFAMSTVLEAYLACYEAVVNSGGTHHVATNANAPF